MIKTKSERISARRAEILDSCERLYQKKSFKEITIGEIGRNTTLTRTSVYNYFQTKEEIFLALFQKEWELWVRDLHAILSDYETLSKKELAHEIARTVERRTLLLKLLSMNFYDIEVHCSEELLAESKTAYRQALETMKELFEKFCPDLSEGDIKGIIYCLFPFLYGIFPYSYNREDLVEVMAQTGAGFIYYPAYDLVYNCLSRLLGAAQSRCA